MTEKNIAAQGDIDSFVQEVIDQDSEQEELKSQTPESAPEEVVEDQPKETATKVDDDGVQKRINKITADKYEQQRRADELQKQLDELRASPKAQEAKKPPTLEDHDYDEDAFNEARIKYLVEQGVSDRLNSHTNEQQQAQQQEKAKQVEVAFNERITKLGKDDFADKANAIPLLPDGVADALMQSEDGAELIYHLGSHLDKADAIANMSPAAAMIELGKLSASLSAKQEVKQSAAPDPIEPVKTGGAISSDIGDEMSIEEWMAKYN